MRVELSGFAPFEQGDLTLNVAQVARVRVILSPASINETVSVSAHPPALDASRTSVATVIDTERVEELPVRSRHYLEFVLLAPGVAPSQPGGRSTAGSALPDSGFSFAGLRPRSNMLTIDGLDNNDEFSGASRTELSLEIVREFQVVSNGWSAERPLLLDGQHGFEQIVEGPAAASVLNASQGAPLGASLANVAPSIYTVRSGGWDSSSRQASVGVERGITPDLTASVNYLFVRGHDLPRLVNVNLAPPTIQSGRAVFGSARLDPSRNDIFELQPTASSTYHGLSATLNRRLSHEVEWSASYTWSHATDTASDFEEQPPNPYMLDAERADSRYDERHRFVASALFDLPIGDEEDRKPGEAPAWWERALSNITQLSATFGPFASPLNGFGRPIEAAAARHIQFSIDFEF
ncbi:MAG: hypothetical protein HY047_13600 [Acidobacteria bacterium]|nr:hypothetical protein [Acidobacteriota bacterium]